MDLSRLWTQLLHCHHRSGWEPQRSASPWSGRPFRVHHRDLEGWRTGGLVELIYNRWKIDQSKVRSNPTFRSVTVKTGGATLHISANRENRFVHLFLWKPGEAVTAPNNEQLTVEHSTVGRVQKTNCARMFMANVVRTGKQLQKTMSYFLQNNTMPRIWPGAWFWLWRTFGNFRVYVKGPKQLYTYVCCTCSSFCARPMLMSRVHAPNIL